MNREGEGEGIISKLSIFESIKRRAFRFSRFQF